MAMMASYGGIMAGPCLLRHCKQHKRSLRIFGRASKCINWTCRLYCAVVPLGCQLRMGWSAAVPDCHTRCLGVPLPAACSCRLTTLCPCGNAADWRAAADQDDALLSCSRAAAAVSKQCCSEVLVEAPPHAASAACFLADALFVTDSHASVWLL